MFGDEASFWLDGTLHVTWARVGVQPRVDTFGERKTAHVFGAVSIERRPTFVYQFADVCNARTFLVFLKELIARCPRRKLFLIIDNGPCHNLDALGKTVARRPSASHRALPTAAVLAGAQRDRGRVEDDQEAHHAQPLLPLGRGTRRRAALTIETFKAYSKMIAGHLARFL